MSILVTLIGKPNLMIQDKYRKVFNTRESAFQNKTIASLNLSEYYTDIIERAVELALKIFKEKF
jgi:hypothetical protein